jgi:succinoglycan biosynthesis protein ExoU
VINSVDVVIAAWNRADTIERAMLSALGQPEVCTLIVVDDCSSDDTAARARNIATKYSNRVTITRQSVNRGPAAARNVGLGLARAPWIAVLDADDYFLPGRASYLLSHADGFDFVADNFFQMKEGEEQGRRSSLLEASDGPWQLDLEHFVRGNVSRRGRLRKELGFLKPIVRRSFLDRYRLRYDESLRLGEDYAFYARALAMGAKFVIVPTCGYVSLERSDSLSSRHTKQDLERLRDFDEVLGRIKLLTVGEKRAIRQHYDSVDARVQWIEVYDALKEKNISRFARPFFRSSTVAYVLAVNLIEMAEWRLNRLLAKAYNAPKQILLNWRGKP